METPYRALSFFKHEIVTRDKMQQLQSNYQWINDNTPRGRIFNPTPGGPVRDRLLVVIAGKKVINATKKNGYRIVSVKFGRAFSPTCHPNVTTGINSDFQRTLFCAVRGPKGANIPDSTGFEISVAVQDDPNTKKHEVIKKDLVVNWSAVGFRTDDMHEF